MHSREEKIKAFERLLDVQERLRKECPWDSKQTFESLRPNTIEETFELCDALMNDDRRNICKELGDVMEHVVLYSILGEETGDFDFADVCNKQSDKLMFRHDFINWNENGSWTVADPALYINAEGRVEYRETEENASQHQAVTASPTTATQVESTWEQRKQKEKDGNETVLSGVPASLPSLIKVYRIQDKARNVGFDWRKKEDVWDKVREELSELETELKREDTGRSTRELGDFLFSIINAARLYHLNPDNALEHTNQKFIARFGYIEAQARAMHKDIKELTLEEMDQLWNEAKQNENQ